MNLRYPLQATIEDVDFTAIFASVAHSPILGFVFHHMDGKGACETYGFRLATGKLQSLDPLHRRVRHAVFRILIPFCMWPTSKPIKSCCADELFPRQWALSLLTVRILWAPFCWRRNLSSSRTNRVAWLIGRTVLDLPRSAAPPSVVHGFFAVPI